METNLEAAADTSVDLFGTAAGSDTAADSSAPVVSSADEVGKDYLAAFEEDAQTRTVPSSPVAREAPPRDDRAAVPNAVAVETVTASPGVSGPSAGVPAPAVEHDVSPDAGDSGAPP